jgi:glycosyltransferase involved in cell wall biosynthesis
MQFSCTEASPLTFKEAGIMGLPLLGTNVGGIPEMIIDNYTGSLVEMGNIQEMAKIMYWYLTNKKHREEMGRNANKYCIEHFSLSTEISRWLNIYKSIKDES